MCRAPVGFEQAHRASIGHSIIIDCIAGQHHTRNEEGRSRNPRDESDKNPDGGAAEQLQLSSEGQGQDMQEFAEAGLQFLGGALQVAGGNQ